MNTICNIVSATLMYCHQPGYPQYPVQIQQQPLVEAMGSQSLAIAQGCGRNDARKRLGAPYYSADIAQQCRALGY